MRKLLQDALQICHVVMLVMKLCGKAQTTAIHDRSMITVVADKVVTTTDDSGDDARVDGEAC